jgi:transposase-like protein
MKTLQVIEEILSKVFKWHRFPVSLKAEAVILCFKGLSLRTVREFLLRKGYEVSIEAISGRESPSGNIYDCCSGLCG